MEKKFVLDSKLQSVLLELFSDRFKMPIGIYERIGGETKGLFSSRKHFSVICNFANDDPLLRTYCYNDHAQRSFKSTERCQQQCHMGLWNYCYPIVINNDHCASILFGQRLLKRNKRSTRKVLLESCLKYNLEQSKIDELLHLYKKAEAIDIEYINKIDDEVEHFYEQIRTIFAAHHNYRALIRNMKLKIQHIAHEFLLPVQSITANAEVLSEKLRGSDEMREMSLDIMMEMENLNLTAENLLESFTTEEKYCMSGLNICDMLDRTLLLFKRFSYKNNIQLHFRKPRNINPIIDGSASHLSRAFKNLVHNAVKYSTGSRRFIDIQLEAFIDQVRISVSNYGYGIMPDEYFKVFQDGYRGEAVRDVHRTGSGIGLFEVKKIIEKHGGTIDVRSYDEKSGYLTIFSVTLPRRQK